MSNLDFGLTRDREAARAMLDYLNPLPRSVVRGDAYALLDGEWRFDIALEDRGLHEMWYAGHAYSGTALWPGSIEDHLLVAQTDQQRTRPWLDSVVAWYERDFIVPDHWSGTSDGLTQLTFGACGYETRVWLNGHPLQTVEGEEIHYGGYTSFSYELPPEYLQPVNRLTVRIAHSLDAEVPRGKMESRVYQRGGIWYQTISGAVRSVWLEPVERNRLRTRLTVIGNIEDRLAQFDVTTRIHDPGVYTLRLVIASHAAEGPLATAEFSLPMEAGEMRQRVAVELPGADLWSPAQPSLLHLVVQLVGPDGNVSQIETHFGLRKIEARGRYIYLNNQQVYLDGILYQPGTASYAEIRRHMLAMKELGCNLVRIHIAGIDPRIYDLADELGLLVWVEVPSPHSSSQRSRDNHWAELMRMLVIIGTHPSVVIWSLYNEDWGVQDIATSAETRDYIARVYSFMRVHYPHVLVVDNDGWRHVSRNGVLQSDLLTAHIYQSTSGAWERDLDRLCAGDTQVTHEHLVVGDPFFYRGQTPLVVSEWGGFGFESYGGSADPEVRARQITAYKQALRARPIAGDVYTQATNIEDERNGLLDSETGTLFVPPGLLASGRFVAVTGTA
jgi:hypothetical protein